MKSVEIKGNERTNVGSKYAKAERKSGNVPCVVYGGKEPIHFSAPVFAFKALIYTAEAKRLKLPLVTYFCGSCNPRHAIPSSN